MVRVLWRKARIVPWILRNIAERQSQLSYVVEASRWSVHADGEYITSGLNRQRLLRARITITPKGIRNQIVHLGSIHLFLRPDGTWQRIHPSNTTVLTWFHVVPDLPRNKAIKRAQKDVAVIHTSCMHTKEDLMALGVVPSKIVVIPLGVDLDIFRPPTEEERIALRKRLGIPQGSVVIGSFQKDGVGWGNSMKPKLIKGPDVFVEVVRRLAKDFPVFVLLVGPARGYVISRLESLAIPYRYEGYIAELYEVARYYHALDLYLITSRVEGGPKQILESWATGVPVVSTRVGMVPDIGVDGRDVILVEVEDVQGLAEGAAKVLGNENLARHLRENALFKVREFSWERIALRYYNEIYSRLL